VSVMHTKFNLISSANRRLMDSNRVVLFTILRKGVMLRISSALDTKLIEYGLCGKDGLSRGRLRPSWAIRLS